MVGEHILYDFNSFKFVEVCFTTQDMGYLERCSVGTGKNLYSALLIKVSCQCSLDLIGDGMPNFLCSSLHRCKKYVKVLDSNCRLGYLSFLFYQLSSYILQLCVQDIHM